MIVAKSVDLSQSINAHVFTPSIAPAVTPLLSLGFSMVVASRGRIKVTIFISDCQVRVSSSSEERSTSHKTVKVEAY